MQSEHQGRPRSGWTSRRRSRRRGRAALVGIVLGLLTAGEAAAQDPAGPIIQTPYVPKVGRLEFNFKLGPAIALQQYGGALGAAEFNLGLAINRERTLLLTFSPQVWFIAAPIAVFAFPVGVQWDFAIPRISRNFYVYPSLQAGYAVIVGDFGGTFTGSLGIITPGAGIKYVHNGRINFGFEPIGIPILFGSSFATAFWKLSGYVGIVF